MVRRVDTKTKDTTKNKKEGSKPPRKRSPLWARLLAAILSPLIFLLLTELVLTLVGYGRPGGFFIEWKTSGQKFYLTNEHYCEHFVPKELSRAPETCTLGGKKGPSTVRIFVLGGSAAYGDPDAAYGFCRQLEILLNELSPEVTFEVVNAAVTSMNSHVARRIAKDCAALDPDLFIVFMGNNEVIGPYGPPTLPAWLYASTTFVDADIAARKDTRIGQLIADVAAAARAPRGGQREWMGMEAFLTSQIAYDDPKMRSCYRHFDRNLRDIVRTAHRCGAKTLLCTVPTNLVGCAPFASRHKDGLTAEALARWNRLFQAGRELERAGNPEAALEQYRQAQAIDAQYADLAYCMGNCLLALDRIEEAKASFVKARDLDTLRFRADSAIEAIIRAAGEDLADQGATLLDLNGYLEGYTDSGILGSELLVDHVHLTPHADFLAAYAALGVIAQKLPAAKLSRWQDRRDELLDICRRNLVYDSREAYRIAMEMYRRKTLPPFASQIDHQGELEFLREELYDLRRAVKGRSESEATYVRAIERSPLDPYLNVRYGEFLVAAGRVRDAIEMYRKLLGVRPFDKKIRDGYAQALAAVGLKDQAIAALISEATPYRRSRKEALLTLGTYYVERGMIRQIQAVYQELNKIDGDNIDVLVNLAAAASQTGNLDAMKRYLDKALAMAPDSLQAMINMGNYYAKRDRPREAQKWFAQAVELDPYSELAHIGLGIQSTRTNERDRAIEHITRAAELKPDFVVAYQFLAALYMQANQTEKARRYSDLMTLFMP